MPLQSKEYTRTPRLSILGLFFGDERVKNLFENESIADKIGELESRRFFTTCKSTACIISYFMWNPR